VRSFLRVFIRSHLSRYGQLLKGYAELTTDTYKTKRRTRKRRRGGDVENGFIPSISVVVELFVLFFRRRRLLTG